MKGYFSFAILIVLISIIISYFLLLGHKSRRDFFSFQRFINYEMDISKSIEESAINGALLGASLYIFSKYPDIDIYELNKASKIGSLLAIEYFYKTYEGDIELAIFCINEFDEEKTTLDIINEKTLVIPRESKHFSIGNCENTISSNVFLEGKNITELINNSYIEVSISNPSKSNGLIGISLYDKKNNIGKSIYLENRKININLSRKIKNIDDELKEEIAKFLNLTN